MLIADTNFFEHQNDKLPSARLETHREGVAVGV